MSECRHAASDNPRSAGSCRKCGRILPRRDRDYEAAFLGDVAQLTEQLKGLAFSPGDMALFVQHVVERLEIGAARYGDHDFASKDNLAEAEQEPPDIAGYAVLELERLLHVQADADLIADVRVDLVSASAHAAISDEYLRRARRKLA